MKYVLVKCKDIKLLINEGLDAQSLFDHLSEIEALAAKVSSFHENLLTHSEGEGKALDKESHDLISKIGYKIIGVPFTNHDAELYALDNRLYYDVLELN